jgi:hypothetical protein
MKAADLISRKSNGFWSDLKAGGFFRSVDLLISLEERYLG